MKIVFEENIINDIFEWDVYNYKKALLLWEKYINENNKNKVVLEIGARRGGLSLYFAMRGFGKIICTDIYNPETIARPIHNKYGFNCIEYSALDIIKCHLKEKYDVITFKSVMGGVSKNDNNNNKVLMIENIYNALKSGGSLFFVENMEASTIHRYLRKKFTKHGTYWNYLKMDELNFLFSKFKIFEYKTFGVIGCFGIKENYRKY